MVSSTRCHISYVQLIQKFCNLRLVFILKTVFLGVFVVSVCKIRGQTFWQDLQLLSSFPLTFGNQLVYSWSCVWEVTWGWYDFFSFVMLFYGAFFFVPHGTAVYIEAVSIVSLYYLRDPLFSFSFSCKLCFLYLKIMLCPRRSY